RHFRPDPGRPVEFDERAAAAVLSDLVPGIRLRSRRRDRIVRFPDRVRGGAGLCPHAAVGTADMRRAARRHWPALVMGICVAIYLFPLYWMAISGFKTQAEIFANPPSLFPRDPTLDASRYVIRQENVARYLRNSVIIALPVTLVTVVLSATGAYAMSRLRSKLVD